MYTAYYTINYHPHGKTPSYRGKRRKPGHRARGLTLFGDRVSARRVCALLLAIYIIVGTFCGATALYRAHAEAVAAEKAAADLAEREAAARAEEIARQAAEEAQRAREARLAEARAQAAAEQARLEEEARLAAEREAAEAAIAEQAAKEQAIYEENLYLLAKIITGEAGCSWFSEHHLLMVGTVVMNRVASPEFPNTLEEVLFQRYAYGPVWNGRWDELEPTERAYGVASRLLDGHRECPSYVVFQAEFEQGSGVYELIQEKNALPAYFCISSKPWLYDDYLG